MKKYDLFDLNTPRIEPERTDDRKNASSIYKPITRQREAEQQQRAVYAAHQEAIIKSGTLRSEITKGIQEGKDPYDLLLKAVECISLMTGDRAFYDINKKNIKTIYRSEK